MQVKLDWFSGFQRSRLLENFRALACLEENFDQTVPKNCPNMALSWSLEVLTSLALSFDPVESLLKPLTALKGNLGRRWS